MRDSWTRAISTSIYHHSGNGPSLNSSWSTYILQMPVGVVVTSSPAAGPLLRFCSFPFVSHPRINPDNWPPFIRGTLDRTENLLVQLNGWVISGYLLLTLLIDVAWATFSKLTTNRSNNKSRRSFLKSSIVRLIVTHGLVLLVGKHVIRHIQETNWAKAIRSGKAYRFPVHEDVSGRLPGTLPHKNDVMINKDYASDYYGSYSRVLEYGHPGNVVWRRLKETHAAGYASLPNPALQQNFCRSLIGEIETERRFLKPDLHRQWTRITDQTELLQLCHRELLMASDPLKDALLRQIDALTTETKFGRFYWTAMQNNTMPALLRGWDERIAGSAGTANPVLQTGRPRPTNEAAKAEARPVPFVRWALPKPAQPSMAHSRRHSLPPRQEPKEPFEGAWLQENDTVEVMYRCETNRKSPFVLKTESYTYRRLFEGAGPPSPAVPFADPHASLAFLL